MFRAIYLGALAALFAVAGPGPLHAQANSEQRAQAYYFQAEAALADGRTDDAARYHDQAVELLGSSNAKLSALETKIHFRAKRYEKARHALDRFYRYDAGPNLTKEMAPYIVQIDDKIAEVRQLNAVVDHAVSGCTSLQACQSARANLETIEIEDLRKTSLMRLDEHGCYQGKLSDFCYKLSNRQPKGSSARLAIHNKACELGVGAHCTSAGFIQTSRRNGTPMFSGMMNLSNAVTLYRKACQMGDIHGCTNLAMFYENDDFRIAKNKKLYKQYRETSCWLAVTRNKHISNWQAKHCRKAGFGELPFKGF